YQMYKEGDYQSSRSLIRQTLNEYPLTDNNDRLLLLDIMISGRIDGPTTYQERLQGYLLDAADPELINLARNMLSAVTGTNERDTEAVITPVDVADSLASQNDLPLLKNDVNEDSPAYIYNLDQTHIFVLT